MNFFSNKYIINKIRKNLYFIFIYSLFLIQSAKGSGSELV